MFKKIILIVFLNMTGRGSVIRCAKRHKETGMNPRHQRNLEVAVAVAELSDKDFEAIWEHLFGGTNTNWQRLLQKCHLTEVCPGFCEERFPLEDTIDIEAVREVEFSVSDTGHNSYTQVMHQHRPAGPGSAMLYIANKLGEGEGKYVIGGCDYHSLQEGCVYVVVYDRGLRSIYYELVGEIDSSYICLVR